MTARKTSRRKPARKKVKATGGPAKKPARRKASGKKPARKKAAAPKKAGRKTATGKKAASKKAARKKSARKKPAAGKAASPKKPTRKKAASKPAARPARAATPESQPVEAVRTSVAAAVPVEVGRVTHHFGQVGVGVIAVESAEIRLGDTLHFRGHTTDFFQRVERMELDHQPVEHIGSGQQVAIQVSQRVREGDLVYRVSR
jgi:putative protease